MPSPPNKEVPRYRFREPVPPRPVRRRNLAVPVMVAAILSAVLIFVLIRMFAPPDITIKVPFDVPMLKNNTFSLPTGAPRDKVILVMGVDLSYANGRKEATFNGVRTDTMMLARINGRRKTATVVSIPRDSKVYLPNGQVDKINAAHALGGAEFAVETVENAFGIPIDNFVVINLSGVKELVDTIGGIEVYIEKPMRYRDRTAGLSINFQPGMHKLNGEQAEGFLRFRHDQYGDIGRIRRQQQFVVAVTKKLKDPAILVKIPKLVEISQKYINTDLSFDEMIHLAATGKDLSSNKIRSATLPGRPGGTYVSYWVVDPIAAQQVLDRLILNTAPPPEEEISAKNPAKVGIYYDPAFGKQLPAFISSLEQGPFKVVCKSGQRRGSTQIIEHTERVTDAVTADLQKADSRLTNARLIFAPVGSTFENNTCGASEDYTVVIGGDGL